jgi:hypothetical protein
MSIIWILGIGCCSLLVGGPWLIGACGECNPGRDGEGSAWARAIRSPSIISSFPAGLGDMKMDGEGLLVMCTGFGAGVERLDGVGGGGVGLPDSISDGSSAIWDPLLC